MVLALGWGRAFLRRKLRRASPLHVRRWLNDTDITEPFEFLVGLPPSGRSERRFERWLWPYRQFLLERLVTERRSS
jgi:hypothetical protein